VLLSRALVAPSDVASRLRAPGSLGVIPSPRRGAAPSCRRWRRWWTGWLLVFLVSGVAGDTVAYVQGGWTATLTATIRRYTGQEPRTRFGRLGQAVLIAFLTWATIHLGFGILGPSRGRE